MMIVHLHTRSCYSLLSSTISIDNLIKESKKLGFKSVSLTDVHTMHGAMEFYKKCKQEGLKPLFGLECSVSHQDEMMAVLILAKNDKGYQSLMKFSSILSSGQAFLSYEQINTAKNDLFIIVYGEGGIFESLCVNQDEKAVVDKLLEIKESISSFYLALSYQETSYWKIRNAFLKKCCKGLDIQTVALNKIYYLKSEDEETFRILNGIKLQKTVLDQSLLHIKGRYILSVEEMQNLYEEEDLLNTQYIADMCDVKMEFEKTTLPVFECQSGLSSKQYLSQLCIAGLRKRFENQTIPQIYVDRMKFELGIITSMNFEDYFLIVWDFIRYAKSKKIYVGPGRGSAAGSLVSYCLGITQIDPIEHGLLFERFLNPQRISMPDIDVDFPDDRRDEVIEYVKSKYGTEHIAHIATFGTLATKQVLRDVGRVLDIPLSKIDMICKSVPNALKMTLNRAMNESSRFNQIINSSLAHIKLYEIARKLEGLPRHISVHAAGLVFSRKTLSEVLPIMSFDENTYLTQFTMEYLEQLGLIKMDFLGLRNLTIIDDIVCDIKKIKPNFELLKIPLDNEKTMKCIQDVDTIGIFQLESDGMKSLVSKMKPKDFNEIALVIALFRPGPMENIGLFLDYKQHPEKITYLHPVLEPILKSTYGIIVYQEQVMQIAQIVAGFSLAKADIMRKAMSKKIEKELLKLQEDFIQGCISNGYEKELGVKLFEYILKFANYGFNKSHSVAYALIAYQMAYLKANTPLYFYKALLSNVIGSVSKTAEYIDECRRRNIEVLKPSINYSNDGYTIENNSIRLGLRTIKNVGESATKVILEERKENGLFTDFYDFVARIMTHRFTQKTIECCIDSGALDEFKINRSSLRASLNDAISYASLVRIESDNQIKIDLNLVSKPVLLSVKDNILEKSDREKEVLGFYFSSHPILVIKKQKNIQVESLAILKRKTGYIKGFALIKKIKLHRTKHGDTMSFVNVYDESGEMDLVFMPKSYQRFQEYLVKGNYLSFDAKKEKEDSCIIQSCVKIEL